MKRLIPKRVKRKIKQILKINQKVQIKKNQFEYSVDNNTITIDKYIGKAKTVHIPEKIDEIPVVAIGERAFENCINLVEILIPESVVKIFRSAFKNCVSLKTIELPETLTVLNAEVFASCIVLESIGLSYDLRRICKSAFAGCTNLKQFYYFSKRGISDDMITDRDLYEDQLSVLINYIGASAFEDCTSLKEITIPCKVETINESVFLNCTSLQKVHVHNGLAQIKTGAFLGCKRLGEMKLPLTLKEIAVGAFEANTVIICEEISYAYKFAIENNLLAKAVIKLEDMPKLSSQMIPYSIGEFIDFDKHTPFYNDDDLTTTIEKFEMRMPSYKPIQRPFLPAPSLVKSARYEFKNGAYYNKNKSTQNRAVIMMTGDLMCRKQLQKQAYKSGNYHFDNSFYFVKDILAQSDFAVGNMETMISPSAPFTCEREYVNARTHLNAPESFLGAIRNASFDAVINAQNHVYDTGVRGILETLDLQNKYELMHTGANASANDKRYISVEVNGIKIAILAYFDGAHQLMKKVNFTKSGRKILLNIHELEQINKDMQAAKAEGAEFIIAYCHWGREYTNDLTERQRGFANEVANAGADFIFGAHSHCVQPFDEIQTGDDRIVPVIYSGGNFLSDISTKTEITRNTFISELTLVKDEDGKVKIECNGYYPCRIMELGKKSYSVVPTSFSFAFCSKDAKILKKAARHIEKMLGHKITKLTPKEIKFGELLSNIPFIHPFKIKLLDSEFIHRVLDLSPPLENVIYSSFLRADRVSEHGVGILRSSSDLILSQEELANIAIARGASLLVSSRQIKNYPCLVVDNLKEVIPKLGSAWLEQWEVKKVAVTGSIGKTTTKQTIYAAVGKSYDAIESYSNFNTISGVAHGIQKITDEHNLYIQEVTELACGSISKMIRPDIAVISKISTSHMSLFGDMENVIQNVFAICDGMSDDGVVIINADDEYQVNFKIDLQVVSYGIHNPNADYLATNIRTIYDVKNPRFEFDLTYKNKQIPICINLLGEHNIYCVLAAAATANLLGLSDEEIQKNLLKMKSRKIRNNLVIIKDYYLYLDCYNANEESTKAALETLSRLKNETEKFRRIAVLGNIAGTNFAADAARIHQNVGKAVIDSNVDVLISCGELANDISEEVAQSVQTIKVISTIDLKEAAKVLLQIMEPNDIILFKGNRSDALESIVNEVFDTNF